MFIRRQCNDGFDSNAACTNDSNDFWYSSGGYVVRYVIVCAVILFFFLWFVGGYFHARRRIQKGLPPLAYHRWLVPSSRRRSANPGNTFSFYRYPQHPPTNTNYNGAYGLQNYPEPPPAYHNDVRPPPTYQPPMGGTKMNPDQHEAQMAGEGSAYTGVVQREDDSVQGGGEGRQGGYGGMGWEGLSEPPQAAQQRSGVMRIFRR